jgi:Protein of unknown function (DUF4242)
MPRFIIERNVPDAGRLTAQELKAISQQSGNVLRELGPAITWVHSYVTDDRLYCVYVAANAALIREHARLGGFPVDRICEVRTIIDPTTAE